MKRAPAAELTNAERADRPVAIAPMLPDIIPPEQPWHGPAGADTAEWKRRALAAESQVEDLRAELRNAVGAMTDVTQTLRAISVAERRMVELLGRR